MSETWKQWEGRTVDGKYSLQSYLGGSDHSAVFLTRRGDSEKAAIKLIASDAANETQIQRWKAIGELNHPNLIRIFEVGRCELDGTALLYAVEEYAEENLSQILPERALTAEEARGMLAPILGALHYVHSKGLAHGHIQPSNILAIADQVKVSSDTLAAPGESSRRAASGYDPPEATAGGISAAADVWQLGMTLVEVLTQRVPVWDRSRPSSPPVPATVPEPLRAIAEHCLQVDSGKRWTVEEISDSLEGKRPARASVQGSKGMAAPAIPVARQQSSKWPYWVGVVAVVVAVIFFLARPKPANPPAESSPAANSQSAQSTTQPEPKPSAAAKDEGAPAARDEKASANNDASNKDNETGVVRRVMPQVSPGARRTIQGKIKVRVRVEVNAAGDVAKAKLESGGASKYFSRIALDAARDWKFSPAGADEAGTREWKLQFAFSRARTDVSAVRGKR
jgi:TonB family protein